ncbi:hypothetical protein OEZ86_007316 [Tetradesmus obliquus]|nr:hypothetical protein OEZ86_007316 [Tetradesmus obliquus]
MGDSSCLGVLASIASGQQPPRCLRHRPTLDLSKRSLRFIASCTMSSRHNRLIERAESEEAERRSLNNIYQFTAAAPAAAAAAAAAADPRSCKDISVDASRFTNQAGNPFAHCLDCRQLGPAPQLEELAKGTPTACLLPFSRNSDGHVFVAVLTLEDVPANQEVSFDYGDAYLDAIREAERNRVQIKQEVQACLVLPQLVRVLQQACQLCDQLPDGWQPRDLARPRLAQVLAMLVGSQDQQQQQQQQQQPCHAPELKADAAGCSTLAVTELVQLLDNSGHGMQIAAANALGKRAADRFEGGKQQVAAEPGAVAKLVRLLSSSNEGVQLQGAQALKHLAAGGDYLKQRLAAEPGALTALVQQLLAAEPGLLAALVQLLECSNEDLQHRAAQVLKRLADGRDDVKQRLAAEPGAVAKLVRLLSSSNEGVQLQGAQALMHLAQRDNDIRQQLAAEPAAAAAEALKNLAGHGGSTSRKRTRRTP